ncbi:hypothetical protein FQN57_004717 [Myotisia sp. PD_48]|nr:hypothetical protein FQN57_004717 [Myotisia sp. PD_48]
MSAKRRRLNEAASTLSKPFKSPVRRDSASTSTLHANDTPTVLNPLPCPHPIATSPTIRPSLISPSPSRSPSTAPLTPSQAAQLATLRKKQSALQIRLSSLRQELDELRQATKIEQQNQDTELEGLIKKWRGVSKEAAEELYSVAREKINKMGGVKVWHEKVNQSRMRNGGWGSGWEDEDGGGLDRKEEEEDSEVEREKERRREEIAEEAQQDRERERRDDAGEEEDADGDEESFTIDMMLKSLNVDLKVIGFDKENQRWLD